MNLGKFIVTKKLTLGDLGEGLLVKHPRKENYFFAKKFKSELSPNSLFIEKVNEEVQILGEFQHPNIVKIYGLIHQYDLYFLVMELFIGRTLTRFISGAKQATGELLAKFESIVSALEYAHERSLIHGHLVSDSIFVTKQRAIKIIDFGSTSIPEKAFSIREPVNLLPYLAPEVIKGEKADTRSDIYSVGILLFQILCGALPFNNPNPEAIKKMQLEESVPRIKINQERWDQALNGIIQKSTKKNPDERYQSMFEILRDIRKLYKDSRLKMNPAVSPKEKPVSDSTEDLTSKNRKKMSN